MSFEDILKLLQGGGSALLPLALWLAYKAIKTGEDAVDTLKRIETANVAVKTTLDDHHERVEHKLDDIHDDLGRLPLELIRLRGIG